MQGGKISLEKLYEVLKNQEQGYTLNYSDFQTLFGTQKYLKISDLANILKKFDLHNFDLKAETMSLCFENKKLKIDKLSSLMKQAGYQ